MVAGSPQRCSERAGRAAQQQATRDLDQRRADREIGAEAIAALAAQELLEHVEQRDHATEQDRPAMRPLGSARVRLGDHLAHDDRREAGSLLEESDEGQHDRVDLPFERLAGVDRSEQRLAERIEDPLDHRAVEQIL